MRSFRDLEFSKRKSNRCNYRLPFVSRIPASSPLVHPPIVALLLRLSCNAVEDRVETKRLLGNATAVPVLDLHAIEEHPATRTIVADRKIAVHQILVVRAFAAEKSPPAPSLALGHVVDTVDHRRRRIDALHRRERGIRRLLEYSVELLA